MAETYQEGVPLTFDAHMTKAEKLPDTEAQGVPEALDRFFGKLIQLISTQLHDSPGLAPTVC